MAKKLQKITKIVIKWSLLYILIQKMSILQYCIKYK